MKQTIAILCLLMTGCSYDLKIEHITRAMELCDKQGGLKSITVDSTMSAGYEIRKASCDDSARYPKDAILRSE